MILECITFNLYICSSLRRRSGEFNSSLPPSEDDGLINSLVNITGSLLSSNVISQLTDNVRKMQMLQNEYLTYIRNI